MTVSEFKSCTKNPHPRKEWPLHIKALWHDARGDWEKAHTIIENTIELSSSWVHAYLHRKEGINGMQNSGIVKQVNLFQIAPSQKSGQILPLVILV